MEVEAEALEGLMIAEPWELPGSGAGWRARYRVEGESPQWSECRVADITLTGAVLEVVDDLPDGLRTDLPCSLQIDSIAADEVGITMRAVVRDVEPTEAGPLVHIEFSARREERMLLHLLVRLHSLV